ncbi:MAG: DUF99 family protein [Planctomycetes bacterium]|nr:DUF99 family protein [Planctomycetota bacterium]
MRNFETLLARGKTIRTAGFDDAPFARRKGGSAPLAGVVCSGTRFEGMVWGSVRQDGWGAGEEIRRLLVGGKYLPQIHAVLLDGVAFAGLNVVDIEDLSAAIERPVVAVMRELPDMGALERVVRRLPRPERRLARIRRAGQIHVRPPFVFQVRGADPDATAEVLARVTDTGHVPEALRLAHLVASGVVLGESRGRA